MKKLLFVGLLFLSLQLSCKEESPTEFSSTKGDCNRIGAYCNDGSRSDATGQGACSHHGGVREWICR